MQEALNIVILSSDHKKSLFKCGKKPLDDYLHKQAKQDIKAKVTAVFVAETESKEVTGYYSMSSDHVKRDILPQELIKKLPRYQDLPVTLLGRLAVDEKYIGQGKGKLLLIDALCRAFFTSNIIGSFAVVVDPIDYEAKSFYLSFGFVEIPFTNRMILPMTTIEDLINGE